MEPTGETRQQQQQQLKVYRQTGRLVVLKYFFLRRVASKESLAREDPFKEISALRHFCGRPGFPVVLDVLEGLQGGERVIIKVERDCGLSLFDLATQNHARIPEQWVRACRYRCLRVAIAACVSLYVAAFATWRSAVVCGRP